MILRICFFFFFNDTATTEIYTLSLHDALPISWNANLPERCHDYDVFPWRFRPQLSLNMRPLVQVGVSRSEEHTSELQSRLHLVCRLLLEKKKKHDKKQITHHYSNLSLHITHIC